MAWLSAMAQAIAQAGQNVPWGVLMGRRVLGPERALESPVRKQLYARICASPGQTLMELRRAMGMGWGNLYHHVRRLQAAGLVELAVAGRNCLVFPRGSHATGLHRRASLLRGATARWVAAYVLAHPRCNFKDILADAPVE